MSQNTHETPALGMASRRDFFRRAGLGLGVAASASVLQACDSYEDPVIPPDSSVVGTVLNPDGEPVEGATVTISAPGAQPTTTDAAGRYSFSDITPGTYTVTVSSFTLNALSEFDEQTAQAVVTEGGTAFTANFNFGSTLPVVTFDFSNDFGVLNFAYALEQLEAAFYALVVAHPDFATTFDEDQQAIFQDLAAHEAIHRDFLAAALGANAIPNLLPDFEDIDFGDADSVLETAQIFEDLGVGAYNGAGRYLTDPAFLTIAGKIVSVEARHASVISGLIEGGTIAGEGIINSDGLDPALAPAAVLSAADPFIFNTVSVSNVPTAA